MSDPNANRPGYKQTKAGWIPDDWSLGHVSDICGQPVSGYSANGADRPRENGNPGVMKLSCISGGRFVPSENKAVTAQHELEKLCSPVTEDTLIVSRSNTLELVGAVAYVERSYEGMYLSDLMWGVSRANNTTSSMRWLGYLLCSNPLRAKIQARASGTSGSMRKITKPAFLGIPIPIPPSSEQERIAKILSTCDEAIEKTCDLIKAKQRQKKALMQQLLTGKKRLPGFEGEWKEVKIGDLLEEVSRPVEWDDEELFKLISVRRRSGGLFFREALHGKDILTKVMNTTHTGDFLISKMQVVHGAMAMTPPEFDGGHVSGSYITLVAKDDAPIHMPFFDYLSRTKWLYHLTFISSYGVVIEKMTFNLKDFLKKAVELPPTVEEQERICEILKTCEDEEAALGRKLAALKQQKKALMQKLLTGQVRVKV